MNGVFPDGGARSAVARDWTSQIRADLPMLTLSTAQVRGVRAAYRLEPRRGPVTFTAQRLGLFSLSGEAPAYSGQVVVDMEQCRITGMELAIDPAALRVTVTGGSDRGDWPDLAQRFRRLPSLRFKSTSPAPEDGVRGLLDLGGVPRLQMLETLAASRREDRITGTDIAVFDLAAELYLGALVSGLAQALAGDTVRLHLTLTAEIEPGF